MFKTTAILLLLAVSIQSNDIRSMEIVAMVTEVIANITAARPGIVDCWFYTAHPDPQPDGLLEMILQKSALRSTPLNILKQRLPRRPRRRPTILIMDLRLVQTKPQLIPSIKRMFSKSTNIVVFLDGSSSHHLLDIFLLFGKAGLLNVFYVRTDVSKNYSVNSFAGKTIIMDTFPPVIFPDQVRDMNGYAMELSQVRTNINAAFDNAGESVGPAIDWVRITTQYINASYYVTILKCHSAPECRVISKKTIDGEYDLCIDILPVNHCTNIDDIAVRSSVPATEGLIAPRSGRLKIDELFWIPFEKEVWIVVILVLVLCGLLGLIFPKQFQNNLILLALCSFERTALYRVKRLEKMIAMPLIVFFFILLSAYESLFISLMTNRPQIHNPRTVEDLLRAGIIIEKRGKGSVVDEELRPLVKEVDYEKSYELDGYSAYNELQITLKFMLSAPKNFDFESGQGRYVTLDYTRWTGFRFYFFAHNSPFVDKFRFTHYALEEAGLFIKSRDTFEYNFYRSRRHQTLVKRFVPSIVMLGLEQMSPAWIILGLGLIVSMVVLLIEWIWFTARKICSSQRRFHVQRRGWDKFKTNFTKGRIIIRLHRFVKFH